MFKNNQKIILASKSPRRIEFFKMLGIDVEVFSASIDEEQYRNLEPQKMVQVLSLEKAKVSQEKYFKENNLNIENSDIWFIGADTDVVFNGKSLGKPKDKQDAFNILKTLSGNTHEVISSFSIINLNRNIQKSFFTSTLVTFGNLSDEIINAYIATCECDDKAGAYALQGISSAFIESINGSYSSVIGLDVNKVVNALLKYDIINIKEMLTN